MSYAFRCKNCNSLEPAQLAGEGTVPTKCPTCGAGVTWSVDAGGNPTRTDNPENWIVLADLSPEELAPILEYHALDASEIERHAPFYSVLDANGKNTYNPDGSVVTAPMGTPPPEGAQAPDPTHVPVLVTAEVGEATATEDIPA